MTPIKSFALVILAAVAFLAYSTLFVVDQRERALVVRLGEIQRVIDTPGLYFKMPIVEDLVRVEARTWFFESVDKSVQVVDGRRYLVDAITLMRVVDPRKFRETVGASEDLARDRIETRLDAALRQIYGRLSFESALSRDRAQMMTQIRDQVRPEALSLGIDLVDVRIRRTDLMPDVLNDTYARMNAERFAEAAELRAVGQAQATRIRAEADREAVELIAKSRRESEIVRGEGEASRNQVFAEAFQRDPEFFAFYRSMQAYTKSLSGSDTTLVLRPDSEFFRYFGTESSAPQSRPQTQNEAQPAQ
ncbi:MAG: protease modulator HflC [Parvibaculaceae bacterium]